MRPKAGQGLAKRVAAVVLLPEYGSTKFNIWRCGMGQQRGGLNCGYLRQPGHLEGQPERQRV